MISVENNYNTNLLNYNIRPGDAGTIVFLHGSGFCCDVFSRIFDSEYLRDFQIIAIDLPGHGSSANASCPASTYCIAGFATIINRLLSSLGIANFLVVGWSLGGHVALNMAKKNNNVIGVLTMGTAPVSFGIWGLFRSMRFSKMHLLAAKSDLDIAEAQLYEKMCIGKVADGRFVSNILRTDPNMKRYIARNLLFNSADGQLADLTESNVDICILHGSDDPIISTRYMKCITSPNLYRSTVILFKNAGHAVFLDCPDEFDILLLEFFESLEC